MGDLLKKYKIEIAIVIIGIAVIHGFLFIAPSFNDWSFRIASERAAYFGDFIGGYVGTIFLLLSVVLLFITLRNQREIFQLQQFENNFFELLRIARDNSTEVESKGKKGRAVFVDIKGEVEKIWIMSAEIDVQNTLKKESKINLAYLIMFYGVSQAAINQLRLEVMNLSNNKDEGEIIVLIIKQCESQHRAISERNKKLSEGKTKDYLHFDGHQSRLSHYFRHLYQTVNFIDSRDFLSYDQKYSYVRTLRAQWTTYEQAIFFFNSLSNIGRPWEKIKENDNDKLITKYNLVKNIPQGFIRGINIADYYPDVSYEGEEKTERRKKLESRYS